MKEKLKTGGLASGYILIILIGLTIHVYTTVIATFYSGTIAGLITFLTPGFCQLFWWGVTISKNGFLNLYSLILMGYIITYTVFASIIAKDSE